MTHSASHGEPLSIERVALGIVALYVLNCAGTAFIAVITVFSMLLAGLFLPTPGGVQVDQTSEETAIVVTVIATLVCFALVAAIGCFFIWGAQGVLRGHAPLRSVVFLAVLLILHVLWARWLGLQTINWFNAALACFSIVFMTVRWKRVFP